MEKKIYIEKLRIAATLAVVMIHITMTRGKNFSFQEFGLIPVTVLNIVYKWSNWAVPVFVMITGALLLNPNKEVPLAKIIRYCLRIIEVLAIFGTVYSLMEMVMNNRFRITLSMFPRAIWNVFEQKSWDHLWYLYTLIVLYVLTPLLKAGLKSITDEALNFLLLIMIGCSFLVPMMNELLEMEITKLPIVNYPYLTYYLLGYWFVYKLKSSHIVLNRFILNWGVLSILLMTVTEIYSIKNNGAVYSWITENNLFDFGVACAVFVGGKTVFGQVTHLNSVEKGICKYSFTIYLVHPFYINLLYKLFGIIPASFPIVVGIILLFAIVLLLSYITGIILYKIPILNKIL